MWQKNCNKIRFLPRRTNEMEDPSFCYPSTYISVCNLKNQDNVNSNSQFSGKRCEFRVTH